MIVGGEPSQELFRHFIGTKVQRMCGSGASNNSGDTTYGSEASHQ